MEPLTAQAHRLVRSALNRGDVAIDATAGNGHDTLFLAHEVGPFGHVYACDIQPQAIANTCTRLQQEGVKQVTVFEGSHVELSSRLPTELRGKIGAVMFNLGYLPGGDKGLTTQRETTLAALGDLLTWLRPGGVLTVMVYPGHAAGGPEAEAVEDWCRQLHGPHFLTAITHSSLPARLASSPPRSAGPTLISVTIAKPV